MEINKNFLRSMEIVQNLSANTISGNKSWKLISVKVIIVKALLINMTIKNIIFLVHLNSI